MLDALRTAAAGELTCGGVAEKFDVSQPTISPQIKILLDAGLLMQRTAGKHHYTSVEQGLLAERSKSEKSNRARNPNKPHASNTHLHQCIDTQEFAMTLAKWDFDFAHSSVEFTVRHLLVSKVRGRFTKWSGNLEIDERDLSKSKFDVQIDVASVDTHEPQRDTHLRSKDFFEADKHPYMTFKSNRVEEKSKDLLLVTGDLTLRGVTREVTLSVERGGIVAKDPWGKRRAGFTATGTINRKDFGVSFNQVLDQGGLALSEEVAITLEIEATAAAIATAQIDAVS